MKEPKDKFRWECLDCNTLSLSIVSPVLEEIVFKAEQIYIKHFIEPFLPIFAIRAGFSLITGNLQTALTRYDNHREDIDEDV